ncbi:MAG: thioesterase family protein [Candidatus Omnitrophica bacterium]|nr:thioesterase family protein [Candidatus Omnitrophota bacterium]
MKTVQTDIRVRYQETDNMGVVYYANYLVWFEVARAEYLRSLGTSYRQLEEKGMFMMVVSASCQYKYPARYDDIVNIQASIPEIKNSSLKFDYNLLVGDKVIATGESVHVLTNKEKRPIRITDELKSLLCPDLAKAKKNS